MPGPEQDHGRAQRPGRDDDRGRPDHDPAPDARRRRCWPRRPRRARPRPGPAQPARRGRSAPRSATPRRGAPGSPTASHPGGSRSRIGRSPRSRCRCAASRPISSPEGRRPAEDELSFGGMLGGSRTPSSRSIADTSASTTAVVEPGDAVMRGPARSDGRGRGDARHPVDERAAPDGPADERHDRRVPRDVEAVVEVQPVEGRQLVDGELGLRHERPRLEHDHRPAARRDRPRRRHRRPRSRRRPRRPRSTIGSSPGVVAAR